MNYDLPDLPAKAMPKRDTLERDIVKYLKKRVEERAGETRKVRWEGRNGAPDYLVLLPGRKSVWVETKKPGASLSPTQQREHARLQRYGERTLKINSIAEVDTLIDG